MYIGWTEFLTHNHDLTSVFTSLFIPIPPMPPEIHVPVSPNPDEALAAPFEGIPFFFLDGNLSGEVEPSGSIRRKRFVPDGFLGVDLINERCFELCAMLGPLLYVTSRRQDVAMTSPFDWGLSGTDVDIRFSASMESEVDMVNMASRIGEREREREREREGERERERERELCVAIVPRVLFSETKVNALDIFMEMRHSYCV